MDVEKVGGCEEDERTLGRRATEPQLLGGWKTAPENIPLAVRPPLGLQDCSYRFLIEA